MMRSCASPQNHCKFLALLDHFWEKLLQIFKHKGGVKGHRIKNILATKDLCDDINISRACVLKTLVVYLNEDPDSFFKEYLPSATEEAEKDVATTIIYTLRQNEFGVADDVGVFIEGVKVLTNVESVMLSFILLFGLIYELDLSYPGNLKYTFEFV